MHGLSLVVWHLPLVKEGEGFRRKADALVNAVRGLYVFYVTCHAAGSVACASFHPATYGANSERVLCFSHLLLALFLRAYLRRRGAATFSTRFFRTAWLLLIRSRD